MTKKSVVETDVLIVGTGPAGAAAAALLSTYGIKNILINKFGWTARTPRAHITNQRTMEVLRDLGVEDEASLYATSNTLMGENTYCTSLAGEELGRIKTWGTHPWRAADYELSSPTRMCDLPQNLLEPILVKRAATLGTKVRFDTEYISLIQDKDSVTATVLDRLMGQEYIIRAKYLVGADGANSKVVQDIDLPLEGVMGKSGSINMVFEADLTKYVAHRPSVLYWIIQPGSAVGGLGIGTIRMVRPWYKWLAIWGYDIERGPPEVTEEFATSIVHKLIGDDTIAVKIERTSTWTVNETYATKLSRGRVFCAGDAIHRHPPTNGLGSNTSIQDSFNLAWKIAMVLKGQADPSLLKTYSVERAPIAKQIVKRANKSLEAFPPIAKALGLLDAKTTEEMLANMAARKQPTAKAERQRQALREAIAQSDPVYNCHGVEMNQRYASNAIIGDGSPKEIWKQDQELYHQASSRPGAPVPHVWLHTKTGKVSTKDICGKGYFTLLTGIGGEAWQEAASLASAKLGVKINVHIIGPGQHYEDPYGDFANIRGTKDSGALLVRPDFHVAFRQSEVGNHASDNLLNAMATILGRAENIQKYSAA